MALMTQDNDIFSHQLRLDEQLANKPLRIDNLVPMIPNNKRGISFIIIFKRSLSDISGYTGYTLYVE